MPHALALFGHPVSHSISPRLHEAFGQRTGINLVYERRDTHPGTLRGVLDAFAAEGGVGGNVTLPLKVEAMDCCASLSSRAEAAGAVNTLKRENGAWTGDNTDGAGFYRDITANRGFEPRGKRLLVVGAGGAAAGILAPLLEGGPDALVVANRNADGARELARRVNDPRVAGCGLELLRDMSGFHLVVNATSAGQRRRDPRTWR